MVLKCYHERNTLHRERPVTETKDCKDSEYGQRILYMFLVLLLLVTKEPFFFFFFLLLFFCELRARIRASLTVSAKGTRKGELSTRNDSDASSSSFFVKSLNCGKQLLESELFRTDLAPQNDHGPSKAGERLAKGKSSGTFTLNSPHYITLVGSLQPLCKTCKES